MTEASELIPNPVLPAQFHTAPAWSPEKRLMLAVLEQALGTFHRERRHGRRGAKALADVAAWFASADTASPFAFESICDVLDLDAAAIRRRLVTVPPGRFPFRRPSARPVAIRLRRRPAAASAAGVDRVAARGMRGRGM